MTVGQRSMYGSSESGWIDGELFDLWFRHHFLSHTSPLHPLLLLFDGHSSHYSPSVINKAAKEGIILFCLPPHSTYLTQPLDKGYLFIFKRYWWEECHNYLSSNPEKVINKFTFCQVFWLAIAWSRSMTKENVISGFRYTGVFRINRPDVFTKTPVKSRMADLEAKKVHYLLLFSPFPSRHMFPVHNTTFTTEEILRFQWHYEKGYDLETDVQYNKWVEMYYPQGTYHTLHHHMLERFLLFLFHVHLILLRPEVERFHGFQICQLTLVTTFFQFFKGNAK